MLNNKIDYIKRGSFDELYTPIEAIEMILPYIPNNIKKIWEPTAIQNSKIVEVLRDNGYDVIGSHIDNNQNFFEYDPNDWDMIITNPPYSLKDEFLARAYELGKPFMMLLPLTTLEGNVRNELFSKYGIELLIPSKRFNFKPEKKKSAWFQTSWFCYNINLPQQINFIKI